MDMMCALYKREVRSRKWYIYIFFHTLTIALVNSWFLYRRNTKVLNPTSKTMPMHKFQIMVAKGLVSTNKRLRGRPSLEHMLTPIHTHVQRVQSKPTLDTRRDGLDHFPISEEVRQRCRQCPLGSNRWSFVRCKKCNVWLCFNKQRNCFLDYHAPPV